MIKKLSIHGYKSIENLSIDCSRINLLTGGNMSGKTAVMEALLLGGWKHSAGLPSLDAEFSDVYNSRSEGPITIETVNDDGISRRIVFCGDGTVISSARPADTFVYVPLTKTHLRRRDGFYIMDGDVSDADSSKGIYLAAGETALPDGMDAWVERVTGLSLRDVKSDPAGHYSFRRREGGRLVRRTVSSAVALIFLKFCALPLMSRLICLKPHCLLMPILSLRAILASATPWVLFRPLPPFLG